MYLTYEDYQNMGGTLDEATFLDYAFEAQSIIDWYTFGRLQKMETLPEAVGRLMYRLIGLAKLKADALVLGSQTATYTDESGKSVTVTTSAAIASQSNDGVSISYNMISASDIFDKLQAFQKGGEIDTLVKTYLAMVVDSLGRKVLYRGIYPDE